MVAGLEALGHARVPVPAGKRPPGSTKQFKKRTAKLAELLKVDFTENNAEYVYEHRSDIAHGRDSWITRLSGPVRPEKLDLSESEPVVKMYLKAENLLRTAIIRSIEDVDVSTIFESDTSVAAKLPL